MSTTSGDPRNLNQFLEGSGPLRGGLTESARSAVAAVKTFVATGSAASGSLGGLQAMIQLLSDMGANEAFIHSITEALAAADRSGLGVVTVSDATLAAKLKADGVGAAPAYITVGPSSLMGFPPTSGFVDDPVCALTGNFFHTEVDLSFPARAGVLSLARHYNSLAAGRAGTFGSGWSSVLDMGLVAGAGEGIVVALADGAEVGFLAGADGVLRPETHPRLRLSHLDDGTWVLADGVAPGATRWHFDAAGMLTGISRGAARVALERGGGEVLRLAEAASGRWVSLSWEGGRVSSATSSDGRAVTYAYDDEGHLVGVERPSGAVGYRISAAGLVEAVVDADGVAVVANVYDEAGRVARQRSPFGRVSTYTYSDHGLTVVADEEGSARNALVHDRRGNLTSMVDAYGRTQRMRYDASGHLVGLTERRGATWETTWDASGTRPLRRVGPEGFEESFEWDELGRIVAHHLGPPEAAATTRWSYASAEHTTPSLVVEPGGAETRVEVSDDDLARSITDADGVRVAMTYDADGQMTSVTDALGNATRLSYDPSGSLAAWRLPSSISVTYEADAAGRVLRAVTPKARWSYEWSAAGRALAGVDPAEGPWRASFGPHGALASLTDATGAATGFAYDTYGNIVEITGADGASYRQGFDGLSQLVSATDPGGSTWTYERDPEGELVGIVEPTGAATRRVVDLLGRTTEEADAAGRTWRRVWRADGRLARVVDPAGWAFSYRYDDAGRLVEVADPDGVAGSYTWSPAGRLASRRDASGTETRFSYDPAGRLVGVGDDEGSVSLVLDVDGRVVRAVDERGRVLVVERDEAGRVRTVTDRRGRVRHVDLDEAGRPRTAGTGPGAAAFSYDPRGQLSSAADALGATTTFSYDPVGRLASVTDPLGATTAYGYDPAGRLASLTDASGTSRLLRDPTGALVGVAFPGGGGRRRWLDPSGATVGYSALDAARPSVSVELDPAGRPVGLPRRPGPGPSPRRGDSVELPLDEVGRVSASPAGDLYRHDAAGQLVEWVPAGRRAVAYRYDAGGRLTSEGAGSSEISYEHDALGRLLRRVDAGGQVTTYAYNAAGERISEVGPGEEVSYDWDAAGRLTGITRGAERTGIVLDNLDLPASVGGVEVAWDLSGPWPVVSRIGELSYERDGEALVAVGPDGSRTEGSLDWTGSAGEILDPWGTSAGSGVRLGYRGELVIEHLVWLGARPYDPATRSFLAPDPLPNPPGAPCGANPYHYAWNDPVSLVDPSGLRPLTQDEFNQKKQAEELGHLGAAWEAIKKDPWGSVALGLTVAAGVGLMFVPGGQAIGAGILIGVALSGGAGIATGTFNPRMVAFNGVIGGITGGVGSAFSGAGIATQVAVGAGIGASGSVAQQEVFTGHVDWSQVGISAAVGGAAGGAGAALGKLAAARSVNAGAEGGWTLPEGGGGANINGRWYTEHALERMAPDTPQVRATLEARALSRAEAAGLKPGTSEFGEWWRSYGPDPRGVPPMVVEAEIATPGSTNVRAITGPDGRVITVIPRSR